MSIEQLRKKNPDIKILSVFDGEFSKYGKIIAKYDFIGLKKYAAENLAIPDSGNEYVPSCPKLESFKAFIELRNEFFGEMPIQIGYCNGNNSKLNALEYHKSSEIDISITEMVLLLGHMGDLKNGEYESSNVMAFYLPQFVAVELYSTTLHFAPCKVLKTGFKCVIALPKGTNEKLENAIRSSDEDRLLFARNKWLIAHEEHSVLVKNGACTGIKGENIKIEPID